VCDCTSGIKTLNFVSTSERQIGWDDDDDDDDDDDCEHGRVKIWNEVALAFA
jgi:hypothetical protein